MVFFISSYSPDSTPWGHFPYSTGTWEVSLFNPITDYSS